MLTMTEEQSRNHWRARARFHAAEEYLLSGADSFLDEKEGAGNGNSSGEAPYVRIASGTPTDSAVVMDEDESALEARADKVLRALQGESS